MTLTQAVNSAMAAAAGAPGKSWTWLSTQDDAGPAYAINQDCWAAGYAGLRARAMWNQSTGRYNGPTLIREKGKTATRFAFCARHFRESGLAGVARWLKGDGTLLAPAIASAVNVGISDIQLIMLAAPVPYADVPAAYLWPDDLAKYVDLATTPMAAMTPTLTFADPSTRVTTQAVKSTAGAVTDTPTYDHWQKPDNGGSGSPLLTAVTSAMVAWGGWVGPTTTSNLLMHRAEMEAAASAQAGEAVEFDTIDLTAFEVLPPSASITVSQSAVSANQSVMVSWTTARGDSVTLDGAPVAASGSQAFTLTADHTFYLTVSNSAGTVTSTAVVQVLELPTVVAFAATPGAIDPGGSSTLSWNVTDVDSVTVQGVPVSAIGSQVVTPSSTRRYELVATSAAGTIKAWATVEVTGSEATMSMIASVSGGTMEAPLNPTLAATWIGGVVPTADDTAIISADSTVGYLLGVDSVIWKRAIVHGSLMSTYTPGGALWYADGAGAVIHIQDNAGAAVIVKNGGVMNCDNTSVLISLDALSDSRVLGTLGGWTLLSSGRVLVGTAADQKLVSTGSTETIGMDWNGIAVVESGATLNINPGGWNSFTVVAFAGSTVNGNFAAGNPIIRLVEYSYSARGATRPALPGQMVMGGLAGYF